MPRRRSLRRIVTWHEQLVAGRMAERVVDELEAVEVEVEQRDGLALAARAGERELEVLLQQRAVRQPGERVVVGEVGDLLLGRAALGQVDAGAASSRSRGRRRRARRVAPGDDAPVALAW